MNHKEHSGYTLIEVLVALVIVSVGLLGMAGLQITALKQNQNAYLRSQAMIAAADIVDRMRANTAAVSDGDYFGNGVAYDGSSADTACENASCSSSQMATYDLNNWKYYIQQEIASGGGCVTRVAEARPGFQEDSVSDAEAFCTSSNDTTLPVVVYLWWSDTHFRNSEQSDDGGDIQVITLSADI